MGTVKDNEKGRLVKPVRSTKWPKVSGVSRE